MKYAFNEEGKKIAKKLIEKYHKHLIGVEVAHIFRDEGKKKKPKKGWKEWARAQKAPERFVLLMPSKPVFCITYDYRVWKHISDKQKKALVDHELAHCGYNKDKHRAYMIHHDLEEFRAIFKRHGFWTDGIKAFVESRSKG